MTQKVSHDENSTNKICEKTKKSQKILIFIIFPLIFGILAVILGKDQVINKICKVETKRRPTYIVYDRKGPTSRILSAVDDVLSRLHMDKIDMTGLHPENISISDWDLLWIFHHHDQHKLNWSSLQFHQKINHWPGNYLLTSKSALTMNVLSKYIPIAFLTADQVREFAQEHPEKRFVIKLKSNRGVKLVKPSEMNFTRTKGLKNYFAQEFVENPLLWNGHKFDFSIFVAITSVDPLRVYYYDKTVNLRFTLKPYSTKDPEDVGSYVIGTEHIPGQKFPAVRKYIRNGYTNKHAFEDFMRSKGANLDEIWLKVEDLIRSITLKTEDTVIQGLNRMGSTKYNHFELVRFDMIFNENFDLFLLEVNMSPNLMATDKKIYNKFMFENILFNLFNLIGVGTSYEKENFSFPNGLVEMMVANPDGFSIKPEICLSLDCQRSCDNDQCDICWHCMDNTRRYDLIQAYKEQMNSGDFKRIFPPDQRFLEEANDDFWMDLNDENRKLAEWIWELCKTNRRFC